MPRMNDADIEKALQAKKFPNGPEDQIIAAFGLTWDFLEEVKNKKEWPLASKLAACCIDLGLVAEEAVERAEFWKLLAEEKSEAQEARPKEPPTETQERCPKCKTEVEWVVPPIPGVKPFFQCQDGDCNWISDDDFPVTESKMKGVD